MNGSINHIVIMGNLGDAPEINDGETPRVKVRIATNSSRKVAGAWKTETEWHTAIIFGKSAVAMAKGMVKGDRIYVEGMLKTNEWTDKDGVPRKQLEVVGSTLHDLSGRKDNKR